MRTNARPREARECGYKLSIPRTRNPEIWEEKLCRCLMVIRANGKCLVPGRTSALDLWMISLERGYLVSGGYEKHECDAFQKRRS